jgi:Cdc6-like AAA superfamily ATPase
MKEVAFTQKHGEIYR